MNPLAIVYLVIMVVWFALGLYQHGAAWLSGPVAIEFVLFAILGYAVFWPSGLMRR